MDDFDDDDIFVEPRLVAKRHCCPNCKKDISHLDSVRRSVHINGCLDNEEVKRKADQIQDNYDKTRDCPLCFEPLTPGPHRVTHYKRCARDHNVTAAEMNDMIAHNDKVAQIRKRCGINHTRARQQSNVEIETTLVTKMKKKNAIGPKNLVDEHMQTALALSLSENFGASSALFDKEPVLKQARLPTALELTNSETRLNLMQDRLFQVILSNSSHSPVSQFKNSDYGSEKLTRWWRIHALENASLDDYQIEQLRNSDENLATRSTSQ